MNSPQNFQKISVGVSLVILAIGFSVIGLLSIIHGSLSGDSLDLRTTSCTIGGFAGLVAGSIFFCAAFVYWRRYSSDDKPRVKPIGRTAL
jgi:hypothetical protein